MAIRAACVDVTHLKGVRAPGSLELVGRGDVWAHRGVLHSTRALSSFRGSLSES